MQYNYDFEVATLLLMIIILLHYNFVRQFPTEKAKVFGALLYACTAECAMNIISCIGLEHTDVVPQYLNELAAFIFFLLEGLCAYLIFRYVLVLCDFEKKQNRILKIVGMIPFSVFEILVFLTPFIGVFYYMEDNRYYQGFGANFGYYYLMFFYILDIVMILIQRKRLERRLKVIMVIYTMISVAAVLIQFQTKAILLTSSANLFMIFMMYLSLQNPGELLDPLTGMGNENALELMLKQMEDHKKKGIVVTLDIRQFHQVIELFGIESSNALLEEVGNYLYQLCGRFHVFHVNGDVYTLLLEDEKKSLEVVEKIRKRFDEDWQVNGSRIAVDCILVVQHYPEDFSTIPEYRGIRDYQLEHAKQNRNQQIFETDQTLLAEYRRSMEVEIAIRNALKNHNLQVYFQPIYSLKEKRIVSLEALARIMDEKLGLILPDEFIPLAEKNGSIIQIGEMVLEECCRFLSRHVLSNTSLGIQTIQINVAVAQCMQQKLKESIVPILEKYHISPSMITLEITEGSTISAPELMKHHMKELGELGVAFAVDDYGSGNANYSYLIKFPFKEIKIDKEMTWEYFKSDTARIILENEIRTMHKLGIPLVVEGVETQEQSDAMEQLGVEYIQGYFYGRPMPEKECLRYIRTFHSAPEEYGR